MAAPGPAEARAARSKVAVGAATCLQAGRDSAARAPRGTRLLASQPNPLVGAGLIRFELALAGAVHLELFDLAGRRVRTLADRSFEAVGHELLWNGDGDDGRALAPRLYTLRLVVPDRTETRKLSRFR